MEINEKALEFFKSSPWAIDVSSAKTNAGKVSEPEAPDASSLVGYLETVNSIYQAIWITSIYGVDHINLRINRYGNSSPQKMKMKVDLIKALFTKLGFYVFARRYRKDTPSEFFKIRINWGK